MVDGRFMLPKSVDKVRVENKVTGKPYATGESKGLCSVSEKTIQFLVEFKFLEQSFTGQTCIMCQYWICQRFVRKKKGCVHNTSVCSIISIDMFMLIESVLLLSGKQMYIAVHVFYKNLFLLINYDHGNRF